MAVVRLLATVEATSELCPFTMTLTAAAVLAASNLREGSRMTDVCIQPSCCYAVGKAEGMRMKLVVVTNVVIMCHVFDT